MIIAVDFDGTCVTHAYPNEGDDIGAVPILRKILEKGNEIILYTMRSGKALDDAMQWFLRNDLRLYGVQYNPTQAQWTSSNKCYAQLYIDDAALGCPLIKKEGERPYVDWQKVEKMLIEKEIL